MGQKNPNKPLINQSKKYKREKVFKSIRQLNLSQSRNKYAGGSRPSDFENSRPTSKSAEHDHFDIDVDWQLSLSVNEDIVAYAGLISMMLILI